MAALLSIAFVGFVLFAKPAIGDNGKDEDILVYDAHGKPIGRLELLPLRSDGTLRLGFAKAANAGDIDIEWWQLAEREDLPGYPRIDPQSGGSGLPGAKGEDEDPAYYSKADFENPELMSRVQEGGKFWLLDRPTLDSGFRFESWLVERDGPKQATMLAGVRWGVSVDEGRITGLHDPVLIRRGSRFDIQESLRISGFGGGWEIRFANRYKLP
ncbi:MAG: hypothetical protein H6507_01270 [Calditrichaeota bacterium]|nr:hypothetical protein [Calditrichota bacterium]